MEEDNDEGNFIPIGKLKFFCQMCRKQCKDKNGMNSHLNSFYHKQKMTEYNQDPQKFENKFSNEFETEFMKIFQSQKPGTSILANKIYQELIKDRQHIHLNATKWDSLISFCEYLKDNNKCLIEKQANGGKDYILFREDNNQLKDDMPKKKKLLNKEQQYFQQFASRVNEFEQKNQQNQEKNEGDIDQQNDQLKIEIKLNVFQNNEMKQKELEKTEDLIRIEKGLNKGRQQEQKNEILNEKQINKKQKTEVQESNQSKIEEGWVSEGIIVKIKDKKILEGKLYKKKGIVLQVVNGFLAKIKTLETNIIIQIDEKLLETVIPKENNKVKILKKGKLRGQIGILEKINEKNFCCEVRLENGELKKFDYEDISKFQE